MILKLLCQLDAGMYKLVRIKCELDDVVMPSSPVSSK